MVIPPVFDCESPEPSGRRLSGDRCRERTGAVGRSEFNLNLARLTTRPQRSLGRVPDRRLASYLIVCRSGTHLTTADRRGRAACSKGMRPFRLGTGPCEPHVELATPAGFEPATLSLEG